MLLGRILGFDVVGCVTGRMCDMRFHGHVFQAF